MAVQLQFTPQYAFAAGVFESGAQARFYESSTTTPETVYSDEALSTAHPSPLVADANGQFATVWGADGVNVKVVVTKADGAALFTLDKVVLGNTAIGNAASVSFAPSTENTATNVQQAIINNTPSAFMKTILDDADAEAVRTTLAAAALASPNLTGAPTAPTAATTTDTTQLATTAFVQQEITASVGTDWELVETLATTSGTTLELPSAGALADGYVYAVELLEVEQGSGGNRNLQLSLYGAIGATYLGPVNCGGQTNSDGWYGFMALPTTLRVAMNAHALPSSQLVDVATTGADFTALDSRASEAPVFHFATAQKVDKVRYGLDGGGSFNKGNMKLWRKSL